MAVEQHVYMQMQCRCKATGTVSNDARQWIAGLLASIGTTVLTCLMA